jgi:hypothetical protein
VVDSSPHEEELIDDALLRVRQAADRENRRLPERRRYSAETPATGCRVLAAAAGGAGVQTIAASLGVSVSTLQRWTRGSARGLRFRPIEIVHPAPSVETGTTVAIQITAAGPRVEGLTVETAARLLTLLR